MAAEDIFVVHTLWDAISNGLGLLLFQTDHIWMAYWFREFKGLLERATLWLLKKTRAKGLIQNFQRLKGPSYKPGVDYYSSPICRQILKTETQPKHILLDYCSGTCCSKTFLQGRFADRLFISNLKPVSTELDIIRWLHKYRNRSLRIVGPKLFKLCPWMD